MFNNKLIVGMNLHLRLVLFSQKHVTYWQMGDQYKRFLKQKEKRGRRGKIKSHQDTLIYKEINNIFYY